MIKKKGVLRVHNGDASTGEMLGSVDNLPDGEYDYLIYDRKRNRSLPQLKYLFGVVLKAISDGLPGHPPVDALYRFFEEAYAPPRTCEIQGKKFDYFDLKNVKSIEMDDVIERIIHHATKQWGITIPSRDEMRAPEAREAYVGAYTEMWKSIL
jgi:hypothetical protein